MPLIEQTLEAKVCDHLRALLPEANIVGSRVFDGDMARIDDDVSAAQTMMIKSGIRQHDDFTTSTVNISITIELDTRAELEPDGNLHDETMATVVDTLADWHLDSAKMTDALSFNGFFASELRMDGGSGKSFVRDSTVWQEEISFTIRGTINPAYIKE